MARIKKTMKGGTTVSSVARSPRSRGSGGGSAKAGGGGKRSKAKRREKETEEERALRLEMAVLKEQEEARRKEDRMKLILLERHRAEEKYTRINRLKIANQWRSLLRLARAAELRKELEIMSQSHERELDRKDAMVQMLTHDLEESEEQYQMAARQHLSNVDGLIDIHFRRIHMSEHEFERDLALLRDEFDTERAELQQHHGDEKAELLGIIAAMESAFNDGDAESRQEYQSQRDEVKNRNSEEYNVLRITLENAIEELERHFDNSHSNYLSNTENKSLAFKGLTSKDQDSAKIIELQMRRLQRLHESLHHWRSKLSSNLAEAEERNRALKEEKEAIAGHFGDLKSKMIAFRKLEASRLADLTMSVDKAVKKLDERLGKAERILKLAEINRKLETEREKVLPFYKSSVDPAELEELEKAYEESRKHESSGPEPLAAPEVQPSGQRKSHTYATTPDGRAVNKWNYLDFFYRRHNRALLDKLVLERERKRLQQENQDLRAVLKQYLDGISVSEDVLNDQRNPLFIINNRLKMAAPVSANPPVAVDATTVVRTNRIAY